MIMRESYTTYFATTSSSRSSSELCIRWRYLNVSFVLLLLERVIGLDCFYLLGSCQYLLLKFPNCVVHFGYCSFSWFRHLFIAYDCIVKLSYPASVCVLLVSALLCCTSKH